MKWISSSSIVPVSGASKTFGGSPRDAPALNGGRSCEWRHGGCAAQTPRRDQRGRRRAEAREGVPLRRQLRSQLREARRVLHGASRASLLARRWTRTRAQAGRGLSRPARRRRRPSSGRGAWTSVPPCPRSRATPRCIRPSPRRWTRRRSASSSSGSSSSWSRRGRRCSDDGDDCGREWALVSPRERDLSELPFTGCSPQVLLGDVLARWPASQVLAVYMRVHVCANAGALQTK